MDALNFALVVIIRGIYVCYNASKAVQSVSPRVLFLIHCTHDGWKEGHLFPSVATVTIL